MEAQGTKEGRPAHKLFEHKVGEASPVRSTDGSAVPSEQVLERGIDIGPWTVRVRHGSIANASELDALSDQLDIPPPEMPFLKNALILEHAPSGFTYCFDAIRALQCVDGIRTSLQLTPIDCARECAAGMDIGSTGRHKRTLSRSGIKVAHAGAWGQSRRQALATHGQPPSYLSTTKQYDWTYSSTWPGLPGTSAPADVHAITVPSNAASVFQLGTDYARDRIPVERLGPSSGEPILFYDDIMLYEDELGDNGSSMLNVKVRVMPSGLLVLQRFFLRVDDVVFRVFDTRMYVSFDPHEGDMLPHGTSSISCPRVIRECRGIQAPYADVKRCMPPHRPNDLSILTNVAWVAEQLTKLQARRMRTSPPPQAQAPGITMATPSAAILGEAPSTEPPWEGEGMCVHVAVLQPRST